ncbi:MAG: 1-deoxy-D-xylulose-5-phosphate synthase [Flavobacteriaceae bacterium]|nr:1-deoxy-D-xylulose-5-phosphate synthase [Flavobacteriaceae bacterium]
MSTKFLHNISIPDDLRQLNVIDLPKVAEELRRFIIDIVATKEGHLGASLGVVELTLALHYVFDTPNDKLVWDVGHQAYGHKIITGRKDVFHTNRQLNGIAGFPAISESDYDTFGVGHSSTSISAALGMAIASRLQGEEERQHIAVIGDASIASGIAFEAMNHAGVSKSNLLIILNDNAIGIDPAVGALKDYLTRIKKKRKPKKGNLFKALNFDYSGPVDGHDIEALVNELKRLKQVKGPKFLHVVTTKGKGLSKAEKDQVTYHAPGKFDKHSGDRLQKSSNGFTKFQDVFGQTVVELAAKNERIVGITPAMLTGSSLKLMMETFPERTFDVGIAEQHAVTLSAGMAIQGLVPYCNIYSTFMQRAYDQVIHDVALQNLPVIFCLDRAGLVGEDGATHHGVFDIAYLRCIPNISIFAPRNEAELRNILYTVQSELTGPIAIRYPRGAGNLKEWKKPFETIEIGKGVRLKKGSDIAILSFGITANDISEAIDLQESSSDFGHYDMRFARPLDRELLHEIFNNYQRVITIEDGVKKGGFGSAVLEFANEQNYQVPVKILGIPDSFVEHGSRAELKKLLQLDVSSLSDLLKEEKALL